MGPLQAIERKKAKGKGKGRGGRGKGRLLLGRGKGKGKGCRKGRGRAAQSENSAIRRRLSFSGVDSDQAPPMGSQQVHQGDSAAPATPKIDNDDATMESILLMSSQCPPRPSVMQQLLQVMMSL